MDPLPASPDETTRPNDIVRLIDLLIAVCVSASTVDIILGILAGSPRLIGAGVVLLPLAAFLVVSPRRADPHAPDESATHGRAPR